MQGTTMCRCSDEVCTGLTNDNRILLQPAPWQPAQDHTMQYAIVEFIRLMGGKRNYA